jgi:hypothetical protein
MYTETIKEITLENQDLIIKELENICDKTLFDYENGNKEKVGTDGELDGKLIYRSYDYSPDDNLKLTQLLNDQNIFPTNYLCSLLNGTDGNYKPHSDKHRHISIMYLKTDELSTTNFYKSKIGNKKGFYDFDEVELIDQKIIEKGKLYLFNHQTVHSVSNIHNLRCNISINLSNL